LKKYWCIPPKANAKFVAAMEDVLEVYRRPFDASRPLVCLDEASRQLVISLCTA
jgi:nucleotidyltransferase/DNA polymerase involved in DNA repair